MQYGPRARLLPDSCQKKTYMSTSRLNALFLASALAATAQAQTAGFPAIHVATAAAGSGEAAPAADSAEGGGGESVDQVVVLGTHRADVTALQSSAPIDVISADQLKQSGYDNASQALAALVPSFTYPMSNFGAGSSANRSGALRGMSPDQMLVLVNGKRRYASAWVNNKLVFGRGSQAVDLNAIPVSAIARIEVLRDGASAQYGSDAIAGVINIVLKDAAKGGEVEAEAGKFTKGDGFERKIDGWKGLSLPNGGFLTLSAEAGKQDSTNSERGPDLRQFYFSGDPREATAPRYWSRGAPKTQTYNIVANSELPLTDVIQFYGFANLGYRTADQEHPYRPPMGNDVVRGIFPDGYQPWSRTQSFDSGATVGLRSGDASSGAFDLSATYGRNELKFHTYNSLNPSYGLASPTDFYIGALTNEQTVVDLGYTRELSIAALQRPVTLAAGVTYRHEKYTETAGDDPSWMDGGQRVLDGPNKGQVAPAGSQSFPGQTTSDAGTVGRNVYGGYVSLENQLTEQLNLGLAGRAEHYSDFGSTVTGRVSARYDFTPAFALRSTIGTGFRAPTIGQLGFSSSQTLTSLIDDQRLQYRTLPVDNPAAQALGATALKPEKSDNYAVGLVARPTTNTSVTVDYYLIKVFDRIVLSENLTGPYVQAALAAAGYPTVYGASYFTNGVDTKTDGVDVVGRYRIPLEGSQSLELSTAFNFTKTRITNVVPNPLASIGLVVIGRQSRGLIERANPNTTLNLGALYTIGGFSVNTSVKRYGTYEEFQPTPGLDQVYSAQWVTDTSATWRFTRILSATVGADDLFNSYPDQSIASRSSYRNGKREWSNLSPAGFDGRYIYMRLAAHF